MEDESNFLALKEQQRMFAKRACLPVAHVQVLELLDSSLVCLVTLLFRSLNSAVSWQLGCILG